MSKSIVVRALYLAVLLVAIAAVQVSAGGPVCPPPMCPPPMCGPAPMCAPPLCGPPPCAPRCEENPLAQICRGAFRLVAGVIALPFRVVGCVAQSICPPQRCGPPLVACGPPPMCLPPVCGPMGPPAFGYGRGVGRPVGFGGGAPKRFAPMAEKNKPLPLTLIAGPNDGVFGGYW